MTVMHRARSRLLLKEPIGAHSLLFSDGSRGGAGAPPIDQTEARGDEKISFETRHPLISLSGDRPPPPYLKVWIRHCYQCSQIVV